MFFTRACRRFRFVSTDPNDHSMRRQVMEAKFQIVFMSPEALFAGRKWRELLKEEPYHSNLVGFVRVSRVILFDRTQSTNLL